MIHHCYVERCKAGNRNNNCKYGFPKPHSTYISQKTDGRIVYRRDTESANVVEYSPPFVLMWRGHCHIQFMKTRDHPEFSEAASYYVLKYNLKSEPSFVTTFKEDDKIIAQMKARYISAEEAVARIFSMTFCQHDTSCIFVPTLTPQKRNASFMSVDGRLKQVQMDPVNIYYHRPMELSNVDIMTFYSLFKVIPFNQDMPPDVNVTDIPLMDPSINYDDLCKNFKFGFIYRDPAVPDAKQLVIKRKRKPSISITNKLSINGNTEDFYCQQLLLRGRYRCDEELLDGCSTYQEAFMKKYGNDFNKFVDIEVESNRLFPLHFTSDLFLSSRFSQRDLKNNLFIIFKQSSFFNPVQLLDSLKSDEKITPEKYNEIKDIIDEVKIAISLPEVECNSIIEVVDEELASLIHINISNDEKVAAKASLDASLVSLGTNYNQKLIYDMVTKSYKKRDK